ncbi:MAG TPA: hypothetical protein VMG81_02195 [Thermoplasmata archaeon]|nr:hypothetical protein [Thermoplasmata archaeon]
MSPETHSPLLGRQRRWRAAVFGLAVGIAVLLVLGAFGFRVPGSGGSNNSPVDDGPNFYQLLATVNSSVSNATGGPWSLFSVVGLAAQGDFSPNVRGYEVENQSLPVNDCQRLLPGPTVWNGTIPVTTGTLNSGTAPFWQLAYFSNVTGQVLIVTSSSGAVRVYSPIPATSGCVGAWDPLPYNLTFWADQIYSNDSLPVNSPEAAQVMWDHVGQYWSAQNSPAVEVLWLGAQLFTEIEGSPGGNWGVDYLRCGLAGLAGDQNIISGGVYRDGAYGGALSGTVNCAILNSPPDAGSYRIVASTPNVTVSETAQYVALRFQDVFVYSNGTVTNDEAWGLANWMTSWNLTNTSGQRMPLATPMCRQWVATIADCSASISGWYAVILSASGGWQNSYGELSGGGVGWSEPVTALVSDQQLVIVCPNAWNVAGDTLSVTSTVATSTVNGSLAL